MLRSYQLEANASINAAFAAPAGNRCVVKMFCGTGKSHVMSQGSFLRDARVVVYVFPSLGLIKQFTTTYLADVAKPLLCVSSEAGATTDSATIRRFFEENAGTPIVVAVTYQSMETFWENVPSPVDVVCFDEAHHVVAPSYQPLVFNNPLIRRAVFFTATPVNENGVVMHDPDHQERSHCGPLAYEYNYLRGVAEGYLNPFDVRVDFFLVPEAAAAATTTTIRIYESIARAVATSGNTRVLTFHADVNNAESDTSVSNFVDEAALRDAFRRVYAAEFPDVTVPTGVRMVALSSSSSARERDAILADLDTAGNNDDVFVISSCRTIGEGIDTRNATMCVFVDPKSSPVAIIQNIGRIVRRVPGVWRPRSTILIPCVVDGEKYGACGDDDGRDAAIREDLVTPTGNFGGILNVLAALRQEDEALYDACVASASSSSSTERRQCENVEAFEASSELCDDIATDDEDGDTCAATSSSCSLTFHAPADVQLLWRCASPLDFSKAVSSVIIDCDVVAFDPMEKARGIVERARQRVAGGGRLMPRQIMNPKHEDEKNEDHDALILQRWKRALLQGKGLKSCPNIARDYLDVELPGWRIMRDLEASAMLAARDIVQRAQARVAVGGALLPRSHVANKNSQEARDAAKLMTWKMGLKGVGHWNCPLIVCEFLDIEMIGWRAERDVDATALQTAREIVQRARARVAVERALLPRQIAKPKTHDEKEETRDATKLSSWKMALKGIGFSRCVDALRDYLDKELTGWRDERNLEATALQTAHEIVQRARARVTVGGALLPRANRKPANDDEKQQARDTAKLNTWKMALKGVGSGKSYDVVCEYLDKELTGWRDERNLEAIALQTAHEIVQRARARGTSTNSASLPRHISKPKNDDEKKENDDVSRLDYWKKALKKENPSQRHDIVCKYLDAELPTWRAERDLEAVALHAARDIVDRARARVAGGGAPLPRQIEKPKNDEELLQKKDAQKLSDWEFALKGKKNGSNCPDATRDYLDEELPGWRDDRRATKKHKTAATVATTTATPSPSPSFVFTEPPPSVTPPLLDAHPPLPPPAALPSPSSQPPPPPPPLSPLSALHQRYKTLASRTLAAEFAADPGAWHAYHALAEKNEASRVPRDAVIRKMGELKSRRAKRVVDMGCGKAWIARHFFGDARFAFTNFDHVAVDALVTPADISAVPLDDDSVEIAILCLAMWGSNCATYVAEAARVLETNGLLYVVEPTRRWLNDDGAEHRLRALLVSTGFRVMEEDVQKFSLFVCSKA